MGGEFYPLTTDYPAEEVQAVGTSSSSVFAHSISAAVWLAIVCASRCWSDDTRA